MKQLTAIAGTVGATLRDRSRGVTFRLLEIARTARAEGRLNQDRLKKRYRRLLDSTSRVVGQAKRFAPEITVGVKRAADPLPTACPRGLRDTLDAMLPLARQVMRQTRARLFAGNERSAGKLLSLFEPATEIIRKGRAGKPNEFGKMVKVQEAEHQIVDYEVYDRRPNEADLLAASLRPIRRNAGARRGWSRPMPGSTLPGTRPQPRRWGSRACATSRERKREQKKRWFRSGQKWRTGCEGRISVIKRRHGLERSRQ